MDEQDPVHERRARATTRRAPVVSEAADAAGNPYTASQLESEIAADIGERSPRDRAGLWSLILAGAAILFGIGFSVLSMIVASHFAAMGETPSSADVDGTLAAIHGWMMAMLVLGGIAALCPVVGVVFGIVGVRRPPRVMATTGLIINGLFLLLELGIIAIGVLGAVLSQTS